MHNNRVMLQKTFERPTWNATLAPEGFEHEHWKYKGLWIEFKAESQTTPETSEQCELNGPNKVKFVVDCDGEGEHQDPVQWEYQDQDACNPVFYTKHKGGCSWDSQDTFSGISKFTGAILIIVGAIMSFFGARFIMWVLGFLIFAAVQGIFFTISYSAGFIDPVSVYNSQLAGGNKAIIAVVIGVLGLILGGVAAKYLIKFAHKFLVPIIAFVCGSLAAFLFTSTLPLNGDLVFLKIGIDGVVGGACAFFSHRVQKYIKTVGTAIIGSFMLFKGIGNYAHGFPKLLDALQTGEIDQSELNDAYEGNMGQRAVLYLVGVVLTAILGSYIQLKVTCKEQADDDMMTKEFA